MAVVEINLLPQQYRKQSQPNVWKYATWALLPITAAAMLIPWLMTANKTSDLERQIAAAQGDIDALEPQYNQHTQLLARQAELEQVTNIARTLRDEKTYWSNDLAAFSTQIPAGSGVALTKLTMTPIQTTAATNTATQYGGKTVRREMALTGKASSQQAIINFLNTFENNPNFGVKFQGMQHEEGTDTYDFTANIGVVGAPPAAAATGTPTPTGATPAASTTPASAAPAPAAPAAPAGGNP